MFKKILMVAIAVFAATPAFGANPGYSGHILVGGRGGNTSGEMAVFGADFSGGSDPLGDFDLKLDTIIQLAPTTKDLTMSADISPMVTGRFKKILQRYTLVALDKRGGVVWVNTQANKRGVLMSYSSDRNLWVYRTSTDGGLTWSGLKATHER